ncbi:MAG: DUF3298 and DUF4163 domain-containing protein [Treponema sp.]|jgi:hypothetical protein|nr:DUF3298 and DUF4163 domain-containing protein [Treponema sp.]
MKHHRFCFILLLSVLFFSCRGGPRNAPASGAEFSSYTVKKTITAPEKRGKLSVSLTLLAVPDRAGLSSLLREILYEGMDPDQYANGLIASLEKQAAGMDKNADASGQEWEYMEEFSALGETSDPDVLVISRVRYYYLGGANGMQEKKYFPVSRSRAARVLLGEFVEPAKNGELAVLIEDALRRYAGLEPGAPLTEGGFFENKLEKAPDNFYPARDGLVFAWDFYEIAPRSMGPIEVTIPWEKLRPLR